MSDKLVSQGDSGLLPRFLVRYASRNTRSAYARDLRDFFGTTEVTEVIAGAPEPEHVALWMRALEADGMSAATVERKLASVRSFYNWCQASGLVARNPADRYLVGRPKRRRDRHVVHLSKEEARRVIESCAGPGAERDRLLLSCLLFLALRRSEASAMNAEHLEPSGAHWIIRLPHTKGGEDDWVKCPAFLAGDIRAFQEAEGIASGPLFRSMSTNRSRGRRLTPSGVYKAVRRAASRAGLDFAPHALRHTACTLAIEGGASLQQVKEHARHRDLSTTLAYVHQRDRLRDSGGDYIRI